MSFLWSQFFVRPEWPTASQEGKTVIVTGSNVGLGKEAARHFARLGAATVILAVRNIEKGNAAKDDIVASTKISRDKVQVWQLDMSSYASVKDFAKKVGSLPRVDSFIANAGIATGNYNVAEDNEATITVNVISTFLLAFLVAPKLKETAARYNTRPNLTIVSSEVHAWSNFPQKSAPQGKIFDTLNDEKYWKEAAADRYQVSKLLEVLVVRAFVERYPATSYPVTVNFVNPGLCHSELARDLGWGFWFFKLILARTTEVGGRTLFHAGVQGRESHGQYMSDCRITDPSPFVLSKEGKVAQERVWDELVAKLEAIQPGLLASV